MYVDISMSLRMHANANKPMRATTVQAMAENASVLAWDAATAQSHVGGNAMVGQCSNGLSKYRLRNVCGHLVDSDVHCRTTTIGQGSPWLECAVFAVSLCARVQSLDVLCDGLVDYTRNLRSVPLGQ